MSGNVNRLSTFLFHFSTIEGNFHQEVVLMPLYLSQLRLAVINGIKGQSEEKWNAFRRKLDQVASSIEFNNEFGNLSTKSFVFF
jgi:hypothetical protein